MGSCYRYAAYLLEVAQRLSPTLLKNNTQQAQPVNLLGLREGKIITWQCLDFSGPIQRIFLKASHNWKGQYDICHPCFRLFYKNTLFVLIIRMLGDVMALLWLSFWTNRSLNSFFTQITKKRASHKPTYENLQKSLEAMKSHCLKNGVTDLSMPRQGNPGP